MPDDLPVISSPVGLHPDEVLHAKAAAIGWWFGAEEVEYDEVAPPPAFGLAGPPGLVGFATLIRNRRVRAEAEAFAWPQWRPLGAVDVYVTSERLLIHAADGWYSFWYVEGFRLLATAIDEQLCAVTDTTDPFLLEAPAMRYLHAALSHLVDVEPAGPAPIDATAASPIPNTPPLSCRRQGVIGGARGRWPLARRR